jgi:hypothetical protein
MPLQPLSRAEQGGLYPERVELINPHKQGFNKGGVDMQRSWRLALMTIAALNMSCEALVHHLDIEQDDRKVFPIEMFGFYEEGVINITITDFSVADTASNLELGIMLRSVDSQSAAQTLVEVRTYWA